MGYRRINKNSPSTMSVPGKEPRFYTHNLIRTHSKTEIVILLPRIMRYSVMPKESQLVSGGGGIHSWVLVTPKTKPSLTEGLEIVASMETRHSDSASRKDRSAVSSVFS